MVRLAVMAMIGGRSTFRKCRQTEAVQQTVAADAVPECELELARTVEVRGVDGSAALKIQKLPDLSGGGEWQQAPRRYQTQYFFHGKLPVGRWQPASSALHTQALLAVPSRFFRASVVSPK